MGCVWSTIGGAWSTTKPVPHSDSGPEFAEQQVCLKALRVHVEDQVVFKKYHSVCGGPKDEHGVS